MIEIDGEIHSSKNSPRIVRNRRTGQPCIVKSERAKADEEMLADQLGIQRQEWERMAAGRPYPLFVVFYFLRKTRGRWDFMNLVQGVSDAMVKAGYIPDDDVEHFIPVWGGYEVKKLSPGVQFWVLGRE